MQLSRYKPLTAKCYVALFLLCAENPLKMFANKIAHLWARQMGYLESLLGEDSVSNATQASC